MREFIGHLFLKLMGWKPEGGPPPDPCYVVIAAPHTSNWDFPLLLAMGFHFHLKLAWMGKHQLFRWPFGWLMRRTGGIAIRRDRKGNVVDQMAAHFGEVDRLALAIPAEGTRGLVPYWKSGFYHIALAANVPVVMGYLDYKRKRGGLGPAIHLTGNMKADMDKIRAFYANITGRFPDKFGPIRLREEDAEAAPASSPGTASENP